MHFIINAIFTRLSQSSAIRGFYFWTDKLASKHWNNFPFGSAVKHKKEDYLSLWQEEKSRAYPEIDKYESDIGFKIGEQWLNNLALHTQVVVKTSPLCWQHGRVLYSTLSGWLNEGLNKNIPVVTIWETGTARGFSAICMSKALKDLGRSGRVVTFDVLPHHRRMFWNCIDDLDGAKSRSELLTQWRDLTLNYIIFQQGDSKLSLKKTTTERIHFAFLDGSHTYDDVMFEFNQVKNYQKTGDVIVFDDYTINQFPGLVRAVDEICEYFQYSRIDISAHINRGYVIATKQ